MRHQSIKSTARYAVIVTITILALMAAISPVQAALTPTASPLAMGPKMVFYFAEGSSQPPFDTWFLVENPGGANVNLTFTFFLQPSGTATHTATVGPTSRYSLFANEVIPNQAFSTRIDASAPIFASRSMYVGYDGHVVNGIEAPAAHWFFAEGATVEPFHTWILLQNPTAGSTTATITYQPESGPNVPQNVNLPANSRTSVFANDVLPNRAFSFRVDAPISIIVERAMYRFPGNAATVSSGVTSPSNTWYFSEGRTDFRGMRADTFLLLQNPNPGAVPTQVTLFRTDGANTSFDVNLPGLSRQTIFLNDFMTGSFGIRVSTGMGGAIIAERSVFFGDEPLGAYSTTGSPVLAADWNLAEGETRAPFDELITVLNPGAAPMNGNVAFMLENGSIVNFPFNVPPNSKREILVDDIVTGANSARVTTSQPAVVERTMFIFKEGSIGAHGKIGS